MTPDPDRTVWFIRGTESAVAPCTDAATDIVLRMLAEGNSGNTAIAICSRGTNADNTMIVDPLGDISFANGAVFIDRSASRLGIGTIAPTEDLQINSTSPAIRLVDETDNQAIDLFYDANEFVIENGTTGANIVGIHEGAPANSLKIVSGGNIGLGLSAPSGSCT